jgi:MFS family permease
MRRWLTRDVLLISLSAFFADAGYQALIAGFPIFLVIYLHSPAYMLGFAMALAYGIGPLFAYIGGILADLFGKKKIALLGNLFYSYTLFYRPFLLFFRSDCHFLCWLVGEEL